MSGVTVSRNRLAAGFYFPAAPSMPGLKPPTHLDSQYHNTDAAPLRYWGSIMRDYNNLNIIDIVILITILGQVYFAYCIIIW